MTRIMRLAMFAICNTIDRIQKNICCMFSHRTSTFPIDTFPFKV
jgi:hypothetical protein